MIQLLVTYVHTRTRHAHVHQVNPVFIGYDVLAVTFLPSMTGFLTLSSHCIAEMNNALVLPSTSRYCREVVKVLIRLLCFIRFENVNIDIL